MTGAIALAWFGLVIFGTGVWSMYAMARNKQERVTVTVGDWAFACMLVLVGGGLMVYSVA